VTSGSGHAGGGQCDEQRVGKCEARALGLGLRWCAWNETSSGVVRAGACGAGWAAEARGVRTAAHRYLHARLDARRTGHLHHRHG
jgi:hypothetical protein